MWLDFDFAFVFANFGVNTTAECPLVRFCFSMDISPGSWKKIAKTFNICWAGRARQQFVPSFENCNGIEWLGEILRQNIETKETSSLCCQ